MNHINNNVDGTKQAVLGKAESDTTAQKTLLIV